MTDNNLITEITDIIIRNTVSQKIPTVVFLSESGKGDLIRNIISRIRFPEDKKISLPDEKDYSSEDWKEISDIMLELAQIPLLVKETDNVDEIMTETENFVEELSNGKGLVIITCPASESNEKTADGSYREIFTHKNFAIGENISIMVIDEKR